MCEEEVREYRFTQTKLNNNFALQNARTNTGKRWQLSVRVLSQHLPPLTLLSFIIKRAQRKGRDAEAERTVTLCLLSVTTNKLLHGFLTNPLERSPFSINFLDSFCLPPHCDPAFQAYHHMHLLAKTLARFPIYFVHFWIHTPCHSCVPFFFWHLSITSSFENGKFNLYLGQVVDRKQVHILRKANQISNGVRKMMHSFFTKKTEGGGWKNRKMKRERELPTLTIISRILALHTVSSSLNHSLIKFLISNGYFLLKTILFET